MNRISYIRIAVVGDDNVGKGTLAANYCYQDIDDDHVVLGVDTGFSRQMIGDREVQLIFNIIDAHERFKDIRQKFIGTDIAMLVYDVTRPDSLHNLTSIWMKEIQKANPSSESSSIVQMVVVANKCDLRSKRVIDANEGMEIAKGIGAKIHVETSALEHDQNVESLLLDLVRKCLELKSALI